MLARHCTYGASRSLTARHSNGSEVPLPQTPADLHEAGEPCGAHFSSLRLTLADRGAPACRRSREDAVNRNQAVTRMRKDPRHWKQGLQRLIGEHNHLHATKRKGVNLYAPNRPSM